MTRCHRVKVMLDAFIIEELKRREEEKRRDREQPRLELPLHHEQERGEEKPSDSDDRPKGGVTIIDMGGPG